MEAPAEASSPRSSTSTSDTGGGRARVARVMVGLCACLLDWIGLGWINAWFGRGRGLRRAAFEEWGGIVDDKINVTSIPNSIYALALNKCKIPKSANIRRHEGFRTPALSIPSSKVIMVIGSSSQFDLPILSGRTSSASKRSPFALSTF
jgi:hypothetical protein